MAGFTLDMFSSDQLDLSNYVYRWITDTGARIRIATKNDDYDPVLASEIRDFDPADINAEGGETVRQLVGRDGEGKPVYAHLMKKPREFWDEDQAEGVERRSQQLRGRILDGRTGAAGEKDSAVEHVYVTGEARLGSVGKQVLGAGA
ncbi:MAG: hypothetical protein KGL39_55990 [Patescibacteria group bacterium]|nr:hypothetical protein [Patescibacteria group bacterium]